MHVNHVSPVQWQGGKVWAIGSRVYPGRPPNETFHEFILHVLRETLGEPWRAAQAALPEDERHFVFKCFEQLSVFLGEHTDPEELAREGQVSAEPNGWVRYLISLAWDVATLIHAGEPPDELIDRLRDRDNFQGARYELAIAAIFARLDCSIRWLDADPALRTVKHVEFEATHRPTGQTFAVEAKSRHRAGVLNQPGDAGPRRSAARRRARCPAPVHERDREGARGRAVLRLHRHQRSARGGRRLAGGRPAVDGPAARADRGRAGRLQRDVHHELLAPLRRRRRQRRRHVAARVAAVRARPRSSTTSSPS